MQSDVDQSTVTSQTKERRPGKISLFLWLMIALGIFFRFYNLDKKPFWYDETLTLQHISGYTYHEMYDRLVKGHPVQFKEMAPFQRPNPGRGLGFVLNSLTYSQPEHAPLFYLGTYLWTRTFGADVGTTRYVPAILSLFQLPFVYWLALEIFAVPVAAELAVALMALSPVQMLYAQELREYSLVAAIIALASAVFLRAMRNPSFLNWLFYLITLVFSLYCSLLTAYVVVSHFLYLLAQYGLQRNKVTSSFLITVCGAGFLFIPWIVVLANNARAAYYSVFWLTSAVSTPVLINTWFDNISKIFVDLGENNLHLSNCLSAFVLVLEGYAFYEILRRGRRQPSFLIITLFALPALTLLTLDLVLGGQRSLYMKYMMPIPIAIILAVAFVLYQCQGRGPENVRWFWRVVACCLLACEVASCLVISQTSAWCSRTVRHQDVERVARLLNETPNVAIVSEDGAPLVRQTNFLQMMVLSHLVKPDIYLEFSDDPHVPTVLPGIDRFFIFNPSKESLELMKKQAWSVGQVDNLDYLFMATKDESSR